MLECDFVCAGLGGCAGVVLCVLAWACECTRGLRYTERCDAEFTALELALAALLKLSRGYQNVVPHRVDTFVALSAIFFTINLTLGTRGSYHDISWSKK